MASPDGRELYAVADTQSHRVQHYPRDGDRWVKLPYELPRHVETLAWILTSAWINDSGLDIVRSGTVLGAGFLVPKSEYSFGTQTVRLAGIGRRSLARSPDLLIAWLPLKRLAVGAIYHGTTNIDEFCEDLFFRPEFRVHLALRLAPSCLWFGFFLLTCVVTQALWGSTPGKWICGIRIVQTTFRRCGFARSLLREILLWFDAPPLLQSFLPFLATVLRREPCPFCVVSPSACQRLGDLQLAGTITWRHRRFQISNLKSQTNNEQRTMNNEQ